MEVSLKVLSTWCHSSRHWKYTLTTLLSLLLLFILFRGPILLSTAVHCTFWGVLCSKFPIVEEF